MAFSFSTPSPFQNPQSQQQLFNQQSTPFSSFAQPQQQQQQQQQFQFQQQQQLLQQQPQQQQQIYLYTLDKSPASYSTKWADLHPESQKFLLQIEERILEYKDESQRLEQCTRLYDSSISSDSFELVTNRVIQDLGAASTVMEREKVPLKELTNEVKNMMWHTEKAIRSYMMLRPRFLHQNSSTMSNNASTGQPTNVGQQNTSSIAPMYDFYSGLPKRPSPFLQQTVERFETYLAECCQWIKELEQLVQIDSYKSSSSSGSMLIQSLPSVMSNVHDYFVYVAAKVESLHQHIESMKAAYLADQRRRGEENNPFLEADRRETAKQEAAARRIHPTLHLPTHTNSNSTLGPQSTHGTGLFASPAQPLLPSSTQPQPVSSSLFSTPAASAPTSSLFTTPATSNPSANLFATPAFNNQSSTSLFGTPQTSSFASTPAGGNSLFSTPALNTGSLTGSGASFGAASKSSRPKARTARR